MVSLDELKTNTINLPVVGAVSIAAVGLTALIIFFLLRRKKSVKLTL